jgi:hypothetical protein
MVVFMSKAAVFMPYKKGVPGRMSWVMIKPTKHSALPKATAPAKVIGPPPPVLGEGG